MLEGHRRKGTRLSMSLVKHWMVVGGFMPPGSLRLSQSPHAGLDVGRKVEAAGVGDALAVVDLGSAVGNGEKLVTPARQFRAPLAM